MVPVLDFVCLDTRSMQNKSLNANNSGLIQVAYYLFLYGIKESKQQCSLFS